MNNNINITKMGKFPTLLVREFYEHKTAFVTAPAVIAGIILIAIIAAMIGDGTNNIIVNGARFDDATFFTEHLDADELDDLKRVISAGMIGVGGAILAILPFVVVFPLLNSLYEERIERSYLFWKSMPVSDLQEVLAKLVFIVGVGPFILFTIASALSLATMIIVSPYMWFHDIPFVGVMWSQTPFISGWFGVAANYFVWALWALPIFGWILLASSYAPKAPLMFAVVPPVVIIVLENIFTRNTMLGEAIGSRLGQKFGGVMERVMDMERFTSHRVNFELPGLADATAALGASLMDPSFWAGTAVAAAFITGAVYIRRFRT